MLRSELNFVISCDENEKEIYIKNILTVAMLEENLSSEKTVLNLVLGESCDELEIETASR